MTTFQVVSIPRGPVWTGNEYLMLTSWRPGVIQRIGGDGSLGPTIQLAEDVIPAGSSIAWSGDTIAVLAGGEATRDLVRYKLDGTRLGATNIRMTDPAYDSASVVWAGDRYVVAWMNEAAAMAQVQEVSADGVLGTVYTIGSRSPESANIPFNDVRGLVANATAYALELADVNASTKGYVVIDRATGAISTTAAPQDVAGSQLRERDDSSFGLFGFREFYVLDSNGLSAGTPVAINDYVSDMARTDDGYHLWTTASYMTTMTSTSSTLDMDLDGNLLTSPAPVMMYPSLNGAGGIWRDNGYLTVEDDGAAPDITVRLVQQCTP